MARAALRPWQAFFAFWIPMTILMWWLVFGDDSRQLATMEAIAKGPGVKGTMISGHLDSGGRRPASTASVRLAIPQTFGITSCEVTVPAEELRRLRDGGSITVHVTGGPVPRCYSTFTFQSIDASRIDAVVIGAPLFGAMLAWLFYYPFIRVEWTSAGSLKSRWDGERASAHAR